MPLLGDDPDTDSLSIDLSARPSVVSFEVSEGVALGLRRGRQADLTKLSRARSSCESQIAGLPALVSSLSCTGSSDDKIVPRLASPARSFWQSTNWRDKGRIYNVARLGFSVRIRRPLDDPIQLLIRFVGVVTGVDPAAVMSSVISAPACEQRGHQQGRQQPHLRALSPTAPDRRGKWR
jgi:hypothetical protein